MLLLSRHILLSVGCAAVTLVPTLTVFFIKQDLFSGLVPRILNRIVLFGLSGRLSYGLFDWTVLLVYLSFAFFFLLLSVLKIERSRAA